jgi:hypothetical protein
MKGTGQAKGFLRAYNTIPLRIDMTKQQINKDTVETIVKQDILFHYADCENFEISSIQRKGTFREHWEVEGTLTTKHYGGKRSFKYKLDGSTGEIREYSIS